MKRTPLQRSTYRSLAADEPDPAGEPLVYATSDGRVMRRWKVAPRTYVERVVRDERGQPVRSRPMVAKCIDRTEARRRYEAGETMAAIGQAMGCSHSQLSRTLRQEGVMIRPPSGRAFDPAEVVRRHGAGEGYTAIAADLGVSPHRVRRVLQAAGLRVRQAGRVRGIGLAGGPVGYETEFKAARPRVRRRSGGRCEAQASSRCTAAATHVHHRKMRSQGGTNGLDNLLDVCASCHSTIHRQPARSYAAGWLVQGWAPELPYVPCG